MPEEFYMFGFGDPERETGNPSCVTFFSIQTNDHITQYLTVFYVKNMNQNGNLPQVGVEIKNIWNQHVVKIGKNHVKIEKIIQFFNNHL